ALDHALSVHAELLHFLKERHRVLVVVQRVAGALHALILRTLADETSQLLRLGFDHSRPPSCRRASTNRSRPVRSSSTRTARAQGARETNSATSDARRASTSRARRPPGRRKSTA